MVSPCACVVGPKYSTTRRASRMLLTICWTTLKGKSDPGMKSSKDNSAKRFAAGVSVAGVALRLQKAKTAMRPSLVDSRFPLLSMYSMVIETTPLEFTEALIGPSCPSESAGAETWAAFPGGVQRHEDMKLHSPAE